MDQTTWIQPDLHNFLVADKFRASGPNEHQIKEQ